MSIFDAFYSLGRKINKARGGEADETEQGAARDTFPELTLDMSNEDISKLCAKRLRVWNNSDVKTAFEAAGKENENYWKAKHYDRPHSDKIRPQVDNAIFESLETFLPQATRRNPEPQVKLAYGQGEEQQLLDYASGMQKRLAEIADAQRLRLKVKKATRHWALYLLGAMKAGWDMDKDMPAIRVIRAPKLILDPEATVDEDGYSGEFVGEHRGLPAGHMISTLTAIGGEPGTDKIITDLVKGELGTEIKFIEWWTPQYTCWTLKDDVLLKRKNPHFNWGEDVPQMADPITGKPPVDENGQPLTDHVDGFNHFPAPKMPYMFLSVFNLGKQPVDDTSLIGQNLANQDRINKRIRQIDKNVDGQNTGVVVSAARSGLTEAKAKTVTEAFKRGGTVVIPDGAPREAIDRIAAPQLPTDVYNDLQDTRNRLKDVFGTRGATPSGITSETTVRGKLVNRELDSDRTGGGVTEYIEQLADEAFNWMVQLLVVYDDKYSAGATKPALVVSVKEGSLLPKDSTTIANQAIELAAAKNMSRLDLYKRLDYPNPEELAANAWLEEHAPHLLYPNDPRIAQAIQEQAGAGEKPPSTSINLKDLPPDGQAQLAAKAGIDLHPEAIAAHNAHQSATERINAAATAPIPTEGGGTA